MKSKALCYIGKESPTSERTLGKGLIVIVAQKYIK